MFHETSRDLFSFPDRYVRVIPVNCVGVMGAGLAKTFKHKEPEIAGWFNASSRKGHVHPGQCHQYTSRHDPNIRYLLVTTKDHWRQPSQETWVTNILDTIAYMGKRQAFGIARIALPAIGCGLGGLPYSWLLEQVRSRFEGHESVHVALIKPRSASQTPGRY